MNHRFASNPIAYTGKELRSHWLREVFGLEGDSIVAFVGRCNVSGRDLVDLEDFVAGQTVAGERMLHFIAEMFGVGLPGIVFAQRLLCVIAKGVIEAASGTTTLRRDGDDLYVGDGKLSVSVATISPISGLIHLGLNISKEGVPVKAACLDDLGVDYRVVVHGVLEGFVDEVEGSLRASKKVRPVM